MSGYDPITNDGRSFQRLLDELGRLPGIGPKSAQRIAYYLLEADPDLQLPDNRPLHQHIAKSNLLPHWDKIS